MTSKEYVLQTMQNQGAIYAQALQSASVDMTDTEVVSQSGFIPKFENAILNENMNLRDVGFICQSLDGNVWKLRQNYNSEIYTEQPSYYPAFWLMVITSNPEDAKPFVQSSEVLYMIGNCCTYAEQVYHSLIDYNTHVPTEYPQGWEVVEP